MCSVFIGIASDQKSNNVDLQTSGANLDANSRSVPRAIGDLISHRTVTQESAAKSTHGPDSSAHRRFIDPIAAVKMRMIGRYVLDPPNFFEQVLQHPFRFSLDDEFFRRFIGHESLYPGRTLRPPKVADLLR